MTTDRSALADFLALSALVTDFTVFRLRGTGQAELYLETVTEIVGDATMGELLRAARTIADEPDEHEHDRRLRADILSDPKLGPVTRNIIKLWYIGTWYELPRSWRDRFGVGADDRTFIPSPSSYVEGLLWPAIGAHPPGAKAPGYGTWADAPDIPAGPSRPPRRSSEP